MKPTEQTKTNVKTIESIVSGWSTTNDINSPSHHTYIEEEVFANTSFEYGAKEKITDLLTELYYLVRDSNTDDYRDRDLYRETNDPFYFA